ncbi:MAG: thioredoxin family protein [Candidatus Magasanikbacteria bacterium]|nr:thioredoxin family protein [Candidatus Magasanikbacteria bacterium]
MKNKVVIGLVVILAVAASGYLINQRSHDKKIIEEKNNTEAMMEKEKMDSKENSPMENKTEDTAEMTKENSMTKPDESAMMDKSDAPDKEKMMAQVSPGTYKDYSPATLAEATKNGSKVVLFFWAAWCPDCKAANIDFVTHADQIPAGVTVLKTNYDTEKSLKTKYGITYQHTFVQIDANGNQITKWNGGGINNLVTNLK